MMEIRSKILEYLRTTKENFSYVSGEELAKKLGVSRTTVWNMITELKRRGYHIEAHPRMGYRLMYVPDKLYPEEISWKLGTVVIGKRIYYYESTDSTNTDLWKMAEKGSNEGTVVVTEYQNKGRGRLGREWISPSGKNLLFSILLRPHTEPDFLPIVTITVAVAVVEAISGTLGISTWIKWPNDIYLGSKKLGGILTEASVEQDKVKFVVVGVGLNVNMGKKEFPPSICNSAISLKEIVGRTIDRIQLMREILRKLEEWYTYIYRKEWDNIREMWRKYTVLPEKWVKVVHGDICSEGQIMGIDEKGALLLRDERGIVYSVSSGDLILPEIDI